MTQRTGIYAYIYVACYVAKQHGHVSNNSFVAESSREICTCFPLAVTLMK